jgi:hypothetical protein
MGCFQSDGGNRNAVMAIVVAVIIGAFVTATLVLVIR